MKTKTLEDVVAHILQEEGVCNLGPFKNADEALEVGSNILPKTWGTFLPAPGQADAGESPVVLTLLLSVSTPEGMRPVKAYSRVGDLYPGAKVYTMECLKTRLTAMESKQPAPEEPAHPHIGGEYLVQCKDTGGVVAPSRKVLAFDRKDAGRTYVWCLQQGGRMTCIMEELNWIPAGSKHAILAKAMHAAGLDKHQREAILAAFTEMQLIEGESRE